MLSSSSINESENLNVFENIFDLIKWQWHTAAIPLESGSVERQSGAPGERMEWKSELGLTFHRQSVMFSIPR